jgi:hypothetical protein
MDDLRGVNAVKPLERLPPIKDLRPGRRRPHHRAGGQARHPLASTTRRSILAQIAASPGIRVREFVERPGVGRGGLRYHLLRLQEEGLIVRLGHGCHLTKDGALELDRFRLMKSATALALASALRQAKRGATLQSLGKRVGANSATATHYVRRMTQLGLATTWWGGKALYAKCTAEGRQFIQLLTGDLRGRRATPVVSFGDDAPNVQARNGFKETAMASSS